jgi:hypothetical protein
MTTGMVEQVESFAKPLLLPSDLLAKKIAPSKGCPVAVTTSTGNS